MLLRNNTNRKFVHSYFDDAYKLQLVVLEPGKTLDVAEDVAQSWLKVPGIIEFVEPKKAKALEDENIKLKAELEAIKKAAPKKMAKKK